MTVCQHRHPNLFIFILLTYLTTEKPNVFFKVNDSKHCPALHQPFSNCQKSTPPPQKDNILKVYNV